MTQSTALSPREWRFLALLIVIFLAAGLETDIYLPAFADMMTYFKVDEEHIQQLLTWNFVGMCLSGPLYGPVSDAFGRRRPFLAALGIFLAGSVVTLLAADFDVMLLGRVLQGVGSGGCFTLGTAIIFDAFVADRAVIALNHINTIFPFVMAGAPALGGYLNARFGFRSNFIAVAALVNVSFVAAIFLPETLAPPKRRPLHMPSIAADFKTAATSKPFLQVVFAICALFSIWMAFLSAISVLFVLELGVSKTAFPWYQSVPLAAWLLGSLSAAPLLRRVGASHMRKIGLWSTVAGGVTFILGASLAPKNPSIMVATMACYALGLNWFQNTYFPEAMEMHPDIKGVTASLLTSARLLVSSLVVGITGYCYNRTIYPVVIAMGVVLVLGLGSVLAYERQHRATNDRRSCLSKRPQV